MKTSQLKLFVVALITLPVFAFAFMSTNSVKAVSNVDDDAATTYKAKCAMCHSPKAEKFFDATKTDDQHVEAILKGKKGEKPPYMPGFEAKGMTAEQAKALVEYMKGLRAAGN